MRVLTADSPADLERVLNDLVYDFDGKYGVSEIITRGDGFVVVAVWRPSSEMPPE